MNQLLNLIPEPQSLTYTGGGCVLSTMRALVCRGGDGDAAVSLLRERFPAAVPDVAPAEDGAFSVTLSDGRALPAAAVPDGCDAYALTVTRFGARIDARDQNGLFYGVMTLLQLPDAAPGVCIADHAAVPIRMLHWDLKGYLPKFPVLLDEMKRLAAFKVNAILLEIEDKYDYRCAPEVGVEGAYTYGQMREFSRAAKALHIAVVPKLQSIAHADYLLKHPRYAHLREDGHVFQYCAVDPEAQALWEAMCAELMEIFAEHGPYFHIGADEPGNLGSCPECAKLGAAGSYLHKVGACIDFVTSRGWTPVMWDDIVRNSGKRFSPEEETELRKTLGRKAVFMYWAYGYGGHNNVFPMIGEYAGAGLRVWGASGYAGCDNWAGSVPPLAIRAQNIDAWTDAAVENGLECVCATGWTRIGSADCPAEPQESSWFTALYAASSMWSGRAAAPADFIPALFRRLFGREADPALAASLLNIGASAYGDGGDDPNEPDGLRFLRAAAELESLAGQRTRLLNYFQYYDGKLGNAMEDYRLGLLRGYTANLKNELARRRERTRKLFELYYMPVTVEEILRTRYGYLEKLNARMEELLEQTAVM